MAYRSTGRSTGQRSDLTAATSRSTARSTEKNREHCSQFRSTARSTGPLGCQTCTALWTSVDRTVDWPLVRSTERSTDLACQPVLGLINRVKIILKFLFSSKNSIKILLTFYIEIQTCDKNFKTITKHLSAF